jgi:hypothetical protein
VILKIIRSFRSFRSFQSFRSFRSYRSFRSFQSSRSSGNCFLGVKGREGSDLLVFPPWSESRRNTREGCQFTVSGLGRLFSCFPPPLQAYTPSECLNGCVFAILLYACLPWPTALVFLHANWMSVRLFACFWISVHDYLHVF